MPLPTDLAEAHALILRQREELTAAAARAAGAEAMIAHMKLVIAKLRREQYGQSSERGRKVLDQLELQLEELEAETSENAVTAQEKAAGAKKTVMLQVSAPFHCALMQPAQKSLMVELEGIPFHDPTIPVASNVDARFTARDSDGLVDAVRDALYASKVVAMPRASSRWRRRPASSAGTSISEQSRPYGGAAASSGLAS